MTVSSYRHKTITGPHDDVAQKYSVSKRTLLTGNRTSFFTQPSNTDVFPVVAHRHPQ